MKKNTPLKAQPLPQPHKDTPDTTGHSKPETITPAAPILSDKSLRTIFFFSLLAMLLIVWFAGFNVGFHNDEIEMNTYGRGNYSFYATGGRDTSAFGAAPDGSVGPIRYYGWGFDMIAVGINKMTGMDKGLNEINSRHVVNEFFGVLCIMFAGLTARKIRGWPAAIFAGWLLFLSPSFMGHAYFNTKDLPFATGYIAAIYFIICFLQELPKPTWRTTLWLMLSFYFTINMRIGGLLLLFYLIIFTVIYLAVSKSLLASVIQNIKDVIIKYAVVAGGGILLLVLTWPFVLMNPIHNLLDAVNIVKKFPIKNNITFEGEAINSLELPSHYIPKLLLVTTPVLILLLLVVAVAFLIKRVRTFDWKIVLLVLFAGIFPLVYAISTQVAAYGGWRHFLFIYPAFCIIAAIGLNELMDSFKKPALKMAIGAVCILVIGKPVIWSIQNNPYLYCYYNEIAGGFKNAYYNYDTDYWMISDKESFDWLMEHEHIADSKDTVLIATNMAFFAQYYIPKHYPKAKVKIITSGVTGRNTSDWTYGVFNTLFIKPDYLENFYPLTSTIHTIDIDGMPVTSIIKDTERLDSKAMVALGRSDFRLADSLFAAHIKTTNDKNPALGAHISLVKASLGQNDAAIEIANKCLQFHFAPTLDYYAYCGLGIAYANKQDYHASIRELHNAADMIPGDNYYKSILAQVQSIMKQQNIQ